MSARKLKLACVPEQVNIPIALALEKTMTDSMGSEDEFEVVYVPEGTGKMIEMIEKQEVDVALTVTDAFIVANSKKRNVELAGVWVNSPLVWAICASPYLPEEVKDIKSLLAYRGEQPLRVGISRVGSGSQTMASYMAMLEKTEHPMTFHIANNINGLKDGIQNGSFDIFLWETFTTKPLFDSNDLRKIGEVATPWPAFSFVVSKLEDNAKSHMLVEKLQCFLYPALYEAAYTFTKEKEASADRIIAQYGHSKEDAALWLSKCEYSSSSLMPVRLSVLVQSVEILQRVGLVSKDYELQSLWGGAEHHCKALTLLTE